MFVILLYCFDFSALGQNEIIFTPKAKFFIPSNNSSISFVFNGTYEKASMENNFWSFTRLRINNTQSPATVNLKVSAQDSIVRISTCRIYNNTFAGSRVIGARVRYTVIGSGTQIFYLGLDAKQGDWSVILNGNWIGKNHGWSLSTDGFLTVTGAQGNVTLAYYGFPLSFIENKNGSIQSFLEHHSVLITTVAVVAVSVIVVTLVSLNNKKHRKDAIV